MTREEADELARSAYAEARKLIKSWTSMARIMTRNPRTKVVLTSSGVCSTNGKDISIKTPLELGNMGPHQPEYCGKRDELLMQKCPRCNGIELANIIVIHEISHIVEQTFEAVSLQEKAQILHRAIELECQGDSNSKRAAILKQRIENAPKEKTADYLNLLDLVSPYMPLLFNAAEDVRVNRLMQEYRPGTKVMFEAMTNQIFVKGIMSDDGSTFKWAEAPPNAQAMIGVYCKVSNFQYDSWLDPKVVEDLSDPGLSEVCDRMKEAPTARAMYRLVYPLLENFRKLGYFKAPDEPEDEPAPPPPPQSSDEEQEDPQDQQPENSDSNSEAGDEASEGDQGDDGSEEQESDGNDGGDSGESVSDGEASEESDVRDSEKSDSDSGRTDESDSRSEGNSDERDPGAEDHDGDGGSSEDNAADDAGDSDASDDGATGKSSSGDSDSSEDDAPEERTEDSSGNGSEADREDQRDSDAGSDTEQAPDQPDGDDSSADADTDGQADDMESAGSEGDPSQSDESGARSLEDLFGEPSPDPSDGQDSPQVDPCQPASDEDDLGTGETAGTPQIEDKDSNESPAPYSAEQQEADGLPEMIQELLNIFGGHADKNEEDEEPRSMSMSRDDRQVEDALDRAIEQLEVFDAPSRNITGLKKTRREDWDTSSGYHNPWRNDRYTRSSTDMPDIPQGILTSALQRLRVAFQENRRKEYNRNLKHGKVDSRVLGRRIATDDERLFQRKREPNKRDYAVLVGLDVSGSTSRPSSGNREVCMLDLMKAATFAKCELLHRLGITFSVYAHSGADDYVTIYEIKTFEEPWGREQRESLATLQPTAANLDGHTLEFYRKTIERRRETDKLILYYTDGAMPLENFDEELEILQREIKVCERAGILIVGVGVGNDDPKEHGLDTVRIDEIEEVPHVVDELRKRLQRA